MDEVFLDMVPGRAHLVTPEDKAFAFVQGMFRCYGAPE